MARFKIACIFGTRPEVIKMASVIQQLQSMPHQFEVYILCTGQHRELLVPLLQWFDLHITKNIDIMQPNQQLNWLSAQIMLSLGELFQSEKYDYIIAQGDTTSVLGAALAAFHEKIPFAHVEAGLRTYDRYFPFPEEMNRVLIGRLASVHFAPTLQAANNLRAEGVKAKDILMTGNTVIDALLYTNARLQHNKAQAHSASSPRTILVTTHRRENFGEPLERICHAIKKIATDRRDIRFVCIVHPNPNIKLPIHNLLDNITNIELKEPLPYQELVDILEQSFLVLTDSGGLQEEAPALKKPVLVMRNQTERPEVVSQGGALLVGSDERLIYYWVNKLLDDETFYQSMVIGSSPYGDGTAGKKIAQHIGKILQERSKLSSEDAVI